MLYLMRALLVLLLVAPVSGCNQRLGPVAEQSTPRSRLPTVTPAPPTPVATPPPQATARPTPAPTIIPAPTRSVTETADGPVTMRMAALSLGAKRYAALGDPHAPITVIEFADFGCPYCREFALTVFPGIRTRYIDTGKVYYIYKDLPVVSQHGDLAAQAAQCAGEQGDYWGMHAQLSIDTREWSGSQQDALQAFGRYAAALRLKPGPLERCVSSGRYHAEVQHDMDDAERLGIRNTPIFIIDNRVLIGAQPLEVWQDALDQAISARAAALRGP